MKTLLDSVSCEKVKTVMVIKNNNLVFTQNENVANRTFLNDQNSNDERNNDFPKVKEIFLLTECGDFEVSKGKYIEGCELTTFITFMDGSSKYFQNNVVSNVKKVDLNKTEQISLF